MLDPATMDARLVAALARVRLRAAIVGFVAGAGDEGVEMVAMVQALHRMRDAAKTPQADIDWAMRSIARDGLLVLEAGIFKLGPSARTYLAKWAQQRIAAVTPEPAA